MPKDLVDGSARPVDLSRRPRTTVPVQVVASPVYDLLLSLFVAFSPPARAGEFDQEQEWVTRARTTCSPELLATLRFFFGGEEEGQWAAYRLCGLLWQAPEPMEAEATLRWLAEMPAVEVLTLLMERDGLGDNWRDTALELIAAHLAGKVKKSDAQAVHSFAKRFPLAEREAITRFVTAPAETHTRLITALREWYTLVFSAEVPRITAALTREMTMMTKRQHDLPPEEMATSVLRGIEFDLPASVERIVLAPSLLIMPAIFHFRAGDTVTYCYPVSEAARSATEIQTAQRREMVRLFEALSDDTRLRILRHLADRQMYLTELAENLKLTKATTRHHMVRLRAAGLVTLHLRDHYSYYSLRAETLTEPTRALLRYLHVDAPLATPLLTPAMAEKTGGEQPND